MGNGFHQVTPSKYGGIESVFVILRFLFSHRLDSELKHKSAKVSQQLQGVLSQDGQPEITPLTQENYLFCSSGTETK